MVAESVVAFAACVEKEVREAETEPLPNIEAFIGDYRRNNQREYKQTETFHSFTVQSILEVKNTRLSVVD